MPDAASATAGAGAGGSGSGSAMVPAFAELCRDPVVLALLAACGATECHLVGGVLRDRALGLATHDLDAVVAGRGDEIAGELAARLPARLVKLGGEDFAAYRLVLGAGGASEAAALSGHRILDLWDRQSLPLHDDLARRDFTINSFAFSPRGGEVVDPFGGLADLARRVLRATTERSFEGDPLRVLRLARLLAHLPGFSVEPDTIELARRAAPRLPEVAAERIREELWLLLSQPPSERSAAIGLRALAALDLYPGLWLGTAGASCGQGVAGGHGGREGAAAAAARAAAELAALPDCAGELERLLGMADARPAIDLAAAGYAATFRQLPGAAAAATRAAVRMQEAGYVSARQMSEIAPLLAEPAALPETELERRRFLNRHGRRWLTVACSWGGAAAAAGGAARERWRHAAAPLCELARRAGPGLIDPPRLLTGDDVQRLLGVGAGPRVGAALAALTAAQVDGAVRTRDDAERFLRAFGLEPAGETG
jgi:poly(A) polymerase